jgi:hypothetical protein
MPDDEGGTYLDDYITSVEALPNDIRRDFDLVSSSIWRAMLFDLACHCHLEITNNILSLTLSVFLSLFSSHLPH